MLQLMAGYCQGTERREIKDLLKALVCLCQKENTITQYLKRCIKAESIRWGLRTALAEQ